MLTEAVIIRRLAGIHATAAKNITMQHWEAVALHINHHGEFFVRIPYRANHMQRDHVGDTAELAIQAAEKYVEGKAKTQASEKALSAVAEIQRAISATGNASHVEMLRNIRDIANKVEGLDE